MNRIPPAASPFLAAALLLSGCRQTTPPEQTPPGPVKAQLADQATFGEWTELIGATQPLPDRIARITAPVEGHLVSVLTDENGNPVREGQKVEKDQLIVRLDDRAIRAQIAELAESAKQTELAVQSASLDLQAKMKLAATSTGPEPLVPEIELKKARLALEDAQSKQRAVQAKEKTLKVQLDFHELRAPITGILGPIQVVRGQTLAIGTAVAEITDLSTIDVVAFVPPRVVGRLRLKDVARPVDMKEPPTGAVVFIADQAQPDTGNFLVKVRFDNKVLKFRSNQVARIEVQTEKDKPRTTIPESAVMADQDPPLVVVADDVKLVENEETHKPENIGKAKRLVAKLGLRDRSKHLVELRGLAVVDSATNKETPVPAETWPHIMFITEGGHGLRDGDPIKVTLIKKE